MFNIPVRTDPQSRAMKFLLEHWGFNFTPGDPVEQHDGSYRVPVHLQVRLENVGDLIVPKGNKPVSGPSLASVDEFMLRKLFPRQAKALEVGKGFLPTHPDKPDVIAQLEEWCKVFLESECYWVRHGHLEIEDFLAIQRIVEAFEHELIIRACRCPHCGELGYKVFEPEM